MTPYRAVFDAAVTFSNEGGLQAQGFRVDLPSADVSDELVAELFVRSLDLLMTESATVSNVQIIEEPHKGTRGGPSDPRLVPRAPASTSSLTFVRENSPVRPLIRSVDRTVPITVQTRTSLSSADAFRIIVPIDLSLVFKGWGLFPGVRGVKNQTGAWDAAGQSRNPDLTDGSTANEVLTEYSPPGSFAYEITHFTNAMKSMVAGVRGEWTFTPDGDGTLIRWTYEFKPLPGRNLLIHRVVGPLWRKYMKAGLRGCVDSAERIRALEASGNADDDEKLAQT